MDEEMDAILQGYWTVLEDTEKNSSDSMLKDEINW